MVSDFPVDVWKKTSDDTDGRPEPATPTSSGCIDGKFIDTTWDFTGCGYYWADECQTRIGYFVDKTIALDMLSQSQAYFTGRDTSTDVRKYAIGYILPFKAQIQEKIGALLAERLHVDRAVLDAAATRSVQQPGLVDEPAEHGGAAGDAGASSTRRAASRCSCTPALYGLSAFPTTFDHSFVDTTRIFVVGNGEAPVPDVELLTRRDAGAAGDGVTERSSWPTAAPSSGSSSRTRRRARPTRRSRSRASVARRRLDRRPDEPTATTPARACSRRR